jgi:tRNA (guanine-N7-)-methyltransferase
VSEIVKQPKRGIRSFVRREGRMTPGQENALERLLPMYGLSMGVAAWDMPAVFGRCAPIILEIGFGSGQSLLALAAAHPNKDFIGIETHRPGVGSLLLGIEKAQLTNVRVCLADAVEVLTHQVIKHSLSCVQLFFPDPWHKRKHHKRRLVQEPFISLVVSCLQSGGTIHIATDWEDYALHIMQVLSAHPNLHNSWGEGIYAPRSAHRPIVTRFEARGQRRGHGVWECEFFKGPMALSIIS